MFYFAYIDATNTCTGVYAMPTDLSAVPGYIAITEEQFTSQSVVGMVWNASTQTWEDPIIFACTTDEVNYKGTGVKLTTKLDAIDEAIAAFGESAGTPGTDGEDGADGTTVVVGTTTTGEAGTDASVTGTLDEETNTLTLDFVIPRGANGESGSSASITAAEVLEKIKGVDGQNSGLDADLLDGHNSDYFATAEQLNDKADAEHSHTGYAAESHTHDGYATADHTHDGFATAEHTHDGYASATDLAGKADANHTHNEYITATTYANGMSGKADTGHTHTPASIGASPSTHTHTPSSIGAAPASHSHSEYASSNHSHLGYASSSHTHSDYLPKSGGTVNGDLGVSGIIRVNGQQSIYDSGSMITLSTNNRETMIAGSKIYSKTTISVSSDRRLKENIEDVSAEDMAAIVKGLDIKTFNYIGNDEPCIGVIAQEVAESCPEYAKYFLRQDENGYFSVKAADLVFPLIATVQKLAKEIEELKK